MQVIGAGVGRTGTSSLQAALEQLLGGRVYHMNEVLKHPHHTALWRGTVRGQLPDWNLIYADFVATVDWPGAGFWRPLSEAYPDALVLLSVRSSPDAWFESASKTIDALLMRRPPKRNREWHSMCHELVNKTFTKLPMQREASIAAYERHNAEVRATIPADRLLEWAPGDGWEPLCERLGVAVPEEPFPHLNTEQGFTTMLEERAGSTLLIPRIRRALRR